MHWIIEKMNQIKLRGNHNRRLREGRYCTADPILQPKTKKQELHISILCPKRSKFSQPSKNKTAPPLLTRMVARLPIHGYFQCAASCINNPNLRLLRSTKLVEHITLNAPRSRIQTPTSSGALSIGRPLSLKKHWFLYHNTLHRPDAIENTILPALYQTSH